VTPPEMPFALLRLLRKVDSDPSDKNDAQDNELSAPIICKVVLMALTQTVFQL